MVNVPTHLESDDWLHNPNFIVFGDSLSYGHELVDAPHSAVISGELQPSKYSWPALLGASNCSVPGSSNDRIKRICLHVTADLKPDLVGVSWSFPERIEVPDPSTDKEDPNGDYFNTIGHWIQGRKSKFNISNWIKRGIKVPNSDLWYKFIDIYYKLVYSDVYGAYRLLDNVYTTQLHLKSLDIEYFMVAPSYKTLQINDKYLFEYKNDMINLDKIIGSVVRTGQLIDWSKFIFIENETSKYNGIMDIGKKFNDMGEHGHPLEKTHKFYAEHLKDATI
tara:strand:- start:374 stop:1207 length:834 start_codon:yes stop_codon:yes gene_type:complete